MFSYRAANGSKSNTTLYFAEVRQVAVPVGRQATTTFGRVHQNARHREGGGGRSLLSTIALSNCGRCRAVRLDRLSAVVQHRRRVRCDVTAGSDVTGRDVTRRREQWRHAAAVERDVQQQQQQQ